MTIFKSEKIENFDKNANLVEAQSLYGNELNSHIFLSSSEKIKSYTGDNRFFLGKGGLSNPDALKKYRLKGYVEEKEEAFSYSKNFHTVPD